MASFYCRGRDRIYHHEFWEEEIIDGVSAVALVIISQIKSPLRGFCFYSKKDNSDFGIVVCVAGNSVITKRIALIKRLGLFLAFISMTQ